MKFLGSITGASGLATNQVQASGISGGFQIPAGTKRLYLMPSASGLFFQLGATGTSTTDQNGAALGPGGAVAGPFRTPGVGNAAGTIVAVYNPAGGLVNVRVFGADV